MGVIWYACCFYVGVLGDPGAILGRSWDDPATLEVAMKDPVRSRLGFHRLLLICETHSESLLGTFESKNSFFHIYFQIAFSVGFWL